MTEYEILKKRTIKLLGEIISSESAKPDDEADFVLIEECENLLCELLDADISLSEEDIDARIKKDYTEKQQDPVRKNEKAYITCSRYRVCLDCFVYRCRSSCLHDRS